MEIAPPCALYVRSSVALLGAASGGGAATLSPGCVGLEWSYPGVPADREGRTAHPRPGVPRGRRPTRFFRLAAVVTAETATGFEHQPDPETYDCRACRQKWPCAAARRYLLATTPDPIQLAMRLWTELERAAAVLVDHPPKQLFERFLKWSR